MGSQLPTSDQTSPLAKRRPAVVAWRSPDVDRENMTSRSVESVRPDEHAHGHAVRARTGKQRTVTSVDMNVSAKAAVAVPGRREKPMSVALRKSDND